MSFSTDGTWSEQNDRAAHWTQVEVFPAAVESSISGGRVPDHAGADQAYYHHAQAHSITPISGDDLHQPLPQVSFGGIVPQRNLSWDNDMARNTASQEPMPTSTTRYPGFYR
ncbi:hypothetical protein Tdes44962_MAKER03013 [Teratosphaeria destructans]|uniref:Uncharacterized protein n=1 Tax=Teratosphaeria destructans TaxID=418781 RepID=A0A9W7SRW3_9PEZI|nr:hypothetical protein Tdes44962_MAKER03013 [Teratosphaeria destructans]